MSRVFLALASLLLPIMADAAQKVSLPQADDLASLAKQRAVVERYVSAGSRENYKTPAGKLGLLRALLEAKKFQNEQTYELQCMGIILGDAFVQELGMEWVVVEDEHGRDPALRVPETDIIIYPLTMISKRVERGEALDVFELFNGLADEIDEIKNQQKG